MQEGAICPELLIQQPVEFLTAVTRKSPTVWSRFMEHRKAELATVLVFRTSGVSVNPTPKS
jgi:hypothetical protein